jgi:FkbM family methyltransferase
MRIGWQKCASTLFRWAWTSVPPAARDRLLPYLLSGISDSVQFQYGVPNLRGLLEHLAASGFRPKTVIDLGAFVGNWSRTAHGVFPEARFLLVDGNPANRQPLAATARQFGRSESLIAVLGPENRDEVVFYVQGTGSSVLPEMTSFERTATRLPMRRLDDVMAEHQYEGPFLLKLDVQGFELEVLRGSLATLRCSEVVILEVSLLPYNKGAPLFLDVVTFMAEAGLVVYDFCGQLRRQSDSTLSQTDLVFTRTNSPLRAHKKFWLAEP